MEIEKEAGKNFEKGLFLMYGRTKWGEGFSGFRVIFRTEPSDQPCFTLLRIRNKMDEVVNLRVLRLPCDFLEFELGHSRTPLHDEGEKTECQKNSICW